MARRATLDPGMPRDAGVRPRPAAPPARRSGSAPWRGSGGRWLVWTLRAVAWVVLLVIGYRGVLAIVAGFSASPAPVPGRAPATASTDPVTTAEAYALQFGSVYLNFSPAKADDRAALLASMLPSGANAQLGWNGVGTQTLQSEQVAGIKIQDAHLAIVTVLAEINDSQLIELGVPVYAAGGRFVVTGEPALLPAPKAAAPPAAPAQDTDAAAVSALQEQLPAFFRAYASGGQETLTRFLVPGAQVTGLNGAVTYDQLVSVIAPPGGATRQITVVVSWTVPTSTQTTNSGTRKHPSTSISAASLEMTYDMTVEEQGGTWYVQSIGSSAQMPGPP
ncbi:MAG: conjugal transfer protein [Streptosporangiaceae bacterium]